MNFRLQQTLNREQDEHMMSMMVSSWNHEEMTNLKEKSFLKICFFVM
jgi:hypothetical protein